MHRLTAGVPVADIGAIQYFADDAGAVLYLQLERQA